MPAPLRRGLGAGLVACALWTGCGDTPGATAEEEVRATLGEFGRATAAKDYQALCDRIFAPQLVSELAKVGLPCELAMQESLKEVRAPELEVGKVTVSEREASAQVRSTASGQPPSQDTVRLVEGEQGWQISSLG